MSLKLPKRNLFTFCDSPKQYRLYHYTSIEKMWKILDSEKLRATQACFSNDKGGLEYCILNLLKKKTSRILHNL